jgi:hypothetical protein
MARFTVGVDLGQSADPTALAVAKTVPLPADEIPLDHQGRALWRHTIVHLERFALKTPYPEIVAAVAALVHRPELQAAGRLWLSMGLGWVERLSICFSMRSEGNR